MLYDSAMGDRWIVRTRRRHAAVSLAAVALLFTGFWGPVPENLGIAMTLVATGLLFWTAWSEWHTQEIAKLPPLPIGDPLS